MKYEIRRNTLIVSITGEIDDYAAREIRAKLDYLLMRKEIRNIIFDLTNLSFMDSAGIGLLIGRYKAAKEKRGSCALIISNERIRRILKMSGALSLFDCYESLDEACAELCEKIKIGI